MEILSLAMDDIFVSESRCLVWFVAFDIYIRR